MSLFIKPLITMNFSETQCHFINKNQSQPNFHRAAKDLSDIKASELS